MQKNILFLGAAPTQIPPLRYAREKGYYVITCDYLPENPGHKFAHESYNVSTTDKDAVLELALRLRIDAIVAYASDPAAPTAAYVAEQMGLPGNPYKAVLTLARKDLFRAFLKEHGFNVPRSQSFYDRELARTWLQEIGLPVFIKPVDSSGSKGVTCLNDYAQFDIAFDHAMTYSQERMVVVEAQIVRTRYQVAGDGFIIDGQLRFRCWADEHFDKLCNGLVPIGQTFPTSHPVPWLEVAHAECQRLLTLLGMKIGALNFDFVFTENGEFYFLELGPRNGGCLIPEVVKYATGIDMVKATVDAALGLPCPDLSMKPVVGFWSSYMVHATETGIFQEIKLSDRIRTNIVEQEIWVKPGDHVERYLGSNHTLGTMILKFKSLRDMLTSLDNMENDIRVVVS
ncbi:MAG: ATP-grasp domain-containing protein [Desulfuromonadales bacterium]